MNDMFQQNLEVLRRHASSESITAILGASDQQPVITVSEDDRSRRRFVARMNDETPLTLHSPRAPVDQAERYIDKFAEEYPITSPDTLLICIGFGGQYYVESALKRLSERALLMVVDPCPRAIYDVLEYVNLAELEAYGSNFQFIVNDNWEQIYREFNQTVFAVARRQPSCFVHPALLRVQPDVYSELTEQLAAQIRAADANRTTLVAYSRSWLKNAIENLHAVLDSRPIDCLEGFFKGDPAAVVAAGPTLDETVEILKTYQSRMVVIAVGTALKPLLRAGVKPDFVIVVDGKEVVKKQFENVETSGIVLLAPPNVDPGIYKSFRQEDIVTFASGAMAEFERCLKEWGMEAKALQTMGTVTVSALSAAHFFGCQDIYCFGLDMAGRPDGRHHAVNTVNHEQENNYWDESKFHWVPGNIDEWVPTDGKMKLYIEHIAQYVDRLSSLTNTRTKNINPGGAKIRNVEQILPEDCDLSAVLPSDLDDKKDKMRQFYSNAPLRENSGNRKEKIAETRKELVQLKNIADQIAEYCDELSGKKELNAGKKHTKLRKINQLEDDMKKKKLAKYLVDGAVKVFSIHTLTAFGKVEVDSDEESFKKVHSKAASFYRLLSEGSVWCQEQLDAIAVDRE